LEIMSPQNLYAEPEATENLNISGNIDKNDPQLKENGLPVQLSFYDDLGHTYNLKLNIKQTDEYTNRYSVSVKDITDANDESIFVKKNVAVDGTVTYEAGSIDTVTLGGIEYKLELADDGASYSIVGPNTADGDEGVMLEFSGSNGSFVGINSGNADAALNEILGESIDLVIPETEGVPHPFAESINIDFSKMTMYATGGVSSVDPGRGDLNGYGTGLAAGEMTGIGVDGSGKIYGTYDNGTKKLLGQIAVATFANPSGLESVGDNMFAETQNSGEFDGVGQDPSTGGGSLSAGVLEMSNVDLASEFTHMITTQRGFQANSRIITTSDTMLEELINLKR